MPEAFAIDPKLLVALDDLPLVAQTVVEGFLTGLHRSPFLGYSTEFSSYRPYIQGDNLRHVDWKVWGRTDEFYVKQFEDDTNVVCQILLDTSASMDFGTPNKFNYGRNVAAALAYLMVRQHDAPALTLFAENAVQALPARSGRRQLDDLFLALTGAKAEGRSQTNDSLEGVVATFGRRGLSVVISDLFTGGGSIFDLLRQLHFQRQEVIVFHVLSPEEVDFNLQGEFVMEDSETGEVVPIHATAFRKEFQGRMAAFCDRVEQECSGLEIEYQKLRTDQPLDQALVTYLAKRTTV
jgi:uncharacterized protein (DUF58 family)